MQQASVVKVVAAFVAGVVVALGSALIYVRVSDMTRYRPAVQAMVVPPASAPGQLPDAGQDTSATEQEQTPPPVEPQKKPKVSVEPRRETAPHPVHHGAASRTVVQVAQNTPPPPPSSFDTAPPVSDPVPVPASPSQAPPQEQPETTPAPTPAATPVRQPHVETLQSGTQLVIRLGETLSTDHNYTGDTFRGTLESPIVMDGFIIADKGSKVLGRVVNAQKAGRVEGVSDLILALTEINTTDGQRVRIESTTYDKRGPTSTGEDAAKIAGGAALGAIIGAAAGGGKGAAIGAGAGGAAGTGAVLLTRGKAAVLPTETRLTFRLATPVTITEKLNY